MKKWFVISAAAVLSACVLSCTKEFAPAEEAISVKENPSGSVLKTFSVSTETKGVRCMSDDGESVLEEDTKTILVDSKSVFEAGDSVKILWDGGFSYGEVDSDGNLQALVEEASVYYSVYPKSADVTLSDGSLTVTLPSNVDGSWAGANFMAAKTSSVDADFHFKNICSVMKLTMPADYCTIVIRGNQNEPLCGSETVSFAEDGSISSISASGKVAEIKASYAGGASGDYYIPMFPEASMSNGFCVNMTTTSNSVKGALSVGTVALSRGDLLNVGDAASRVHDWYIKETACGDGSGRDWDNAGDAATLVKLLSKNIWKNGKVVGTFGTYSNYGVNNGRRIHNRYIRIAAGQYDMIDNGAVLTMNYNNINCHIVGGYPASASGKDVSGYDPEANVTLLKTSFTGSNARIFSGQACYRLFEMKGLHFEGGSYTGRGGVIYFNANAKTNASASYKGFVFSDCHFSGNTNTGYGLVCCNFYKNQTSGSHYDEGLGKISFNNCVFSDGESSYANGAAAFMCETSYTKAVFTDCIFSGNSAPSGNGGAVSMTKGGDLSFIRCTFSGNKAKGWGSAVFVNAGRASFSGCTFSGNVSNTDAASLKTFANNKSGAVAVVCNNTASDIPECYIDNCNFINNETENGAGADINVCQSQARRCRLYVNRSLFNGAKSGATKGNTGEKYNGRAVEIESNQQSVQPDAAFYNCTFCNSSSPSSTTMPCVAWMSSSLTLVNCTLVESGVAVLRNDSFADVTAGTAYCGSLNMYNCLVSHTNGSTASANANAINLNLSTLKDSINCGYNIMCNSKNAYRMGSTWNAGTYKWTAGGDNRPVTQTDGYVLYGDMTFTYDDAAGQFQYSIASGKEADEERPVQYTTASAVESFVLERNPSFDSWLKSLHTSPYLVDKAGNARNSVKLNKGSWDTGLSD